MYLGHYHLGVVANKSHAPKALAKKVRRSKYMVMRQISVTEAKKIADKKGLKPGQVKGTSGIQFTKGKNARLDLISWDEFESILGKRKLAVYESGGWMKIMKK